MKQQLSALLRPLAVVSRRLCSLRRLWAHASLQAGLGQQVHSSVVVLGCPDLHGTNNIRIGRNLLLYCSVHLETQCDGVIEIGDDVVISRGVHIASFASICIGAGSMIGEYASIRDANHRFGGPLPLRANGHAALPIVIGREVWIGRGATILPGVCIGDGAVIGANAVVTHDVAPRARVGGVPARALTLPVAA